MHVCYQSFHPIEAHLIASYLNEHKVPARLMNEVSFILGYANVAGPVSLVVPDEYAEQARALLASRDERPALPDDPEFIYEGPQPEALSPWELAVTPRDLVRSILFVILALSILTGIMVIATFADIQALRAR